MRAAAVKAPRRKRAPKITETQEHKAIASYFRKIGLGGCALAFHVRNERPGDWQRLNAYTMGVLAGCPDWIIVDGGRAGFLEIKPRDWKEKRANGGAYTVKELRQLETHNALRRAGCWVEIAETLDEVKEILAAHGVPLRTESITTERIRRGMETEMTKLAEAAE